MTQPDAISADYTLRPSELAAVLALRRGGDPCLRRERLRGRLGLEGRLRGRRGRGGDVRPPLRARHAPAGRRGRGRPPQDAGHARGRRRAGTLAHEALRGAGPPPAVLHAAPARLRRPQGRRRPPGRCRAGAQRRHRHARRDGGMRARQGRGRAAVSERDRGGPRRASRGAVSRHRRHPPQRRGPRRLPAGPASHRRADEPAVLGDARIERILERWPLAA